ncbi:IGPS-domain-containing protein [Rhizoclosmatium globosum]|uniref:Multifunctional tryptophan biosynthesis protein n=1 Tax=Rhizoclosmatium globosum TaxID=329046 RepID=A0A1Y2CJE2_9FUNG|nr:IGPS-domain-containing protein [Rhizoclosmatium globosum]|eukprot:ORY46425.1 IGPS-domain-containing protein [Rhizoclosmatium globosum]
MTVASTAAHSGKTIMIDNYDSFTWNVYGVLSQLGADVEVFRNDEITLEQLKALNPKNIVISPGPGHPRDAGISMAVIKEFGGKVPILGVCLGEQAMFECYGGTVKFAGEIVHGKTSPVKHDGKGLYKGVSQGIEVTRYHSLAGDKNTLPDCLEITSTTPSGVVMGVRHKTFVMEGVQYHPESIASEEGNRLIANFLSWEGGLWETMVEKPIYVATPKSQRKRLGALEHNHPSIASPAPTSAPHKKTILETIAEQRLRDVEETVKLPGHSLKDLQTALSLGLAPKQIDFGKRLLAAAPNVAVLAEIKRASPSKGPIDMDTHAPSQALLYATSGASAISVLTEPTWFKGTLQDMKLARAAVDDLENRPAILRKDFVVDEYQIYEARLAGADTVLLIVAILLGDGVLKGLIDVSRALGMEPLVEVANAEEMRIAVDVGAKIIGVNNRDLHTFTVDMSRTSTLASMVPKDTILIALSGITGRSDVEKYVASGAAGVLVGEHLMKSKDKRLFIRDLIGLPTPMDIVSTPSSTPSAPEKTLVKVCGITNVSDAQIAAKSGANFIGLIFAPSPRQVTPAKAKEIIDTLTQSTPRQKFTLPARPPLCSTQEWYTRSHTALKTHIATSSSNTPLFVGVFSNTPFEEINAIVRETGLDMVQFHGSEDPALLAPLICVPVIKAFHVHKGDTAISVLAQIERGNGVLAAALLDTGVKGLEQQGGSGVTFDWELAKSLVKGCGVPIWVAGGLDSENGVKDHGKVERFVAGAKAV